MKSLFADKHFIFETLGGNHLIYCWITVQGPSQTYWANVVKTYDCLSKQSHQGPQREWDSPAKRTVLIYGYVGWNSPRLGLDKSLRPLDPKQSTLTSLPLFVLVLINLID